MAKQVIQSPDAPAAIGPYSQAILAGNTLYMSGQVPLDPATGKLVEGIDAQAHQVFKNLRAVAGAGSSGICADMYSVLPARIACECRPWPAGASESSGSLAWPWHSAWGGAGFSSIGVRVAREKNQVRYRGSSPPGTQ